jgi:hypothetical protein
MTESMIVPASSPSTITKYRIQERILFENNDLTSLFFVEGNGLALFRV